MKIPIPVVLSQAATTLQGVANRTPPPVRTALALTGVAVAAFPMGIALGKQRLKRKAARATSQAPGMPSLTTPPHPGQQHLAPPADPEVFSPGFNIHPELSTVPTLLDGAEASEDVRMLANMYNRTYETPEYDTNAALEMLMGHPPGTRGNKTNKD